MTGIVKTRADGRRLRRVGYGILGILSKLLTLFVSKKPSGAEVLDETTGVGTQRDPQPGRCYDFDGTDDYVSLSDSVSVAGTLTYSAWVNVDSLPTHAALISYKSTLLQLTSTGLLTFFANTSAVGETSTIAVSTGEWSHVAISQSGTTYTFYVDGSPAGSGTGIAINDTDVSEDNLGRWKAADPRYLNGKLNDVRIYDDALTADEVTHLYTDGAAGTDPETTNLVAQYKCDESAGTTAYDSSGNGNHGTITNATLSTFHAADSDLSKSFQNDVGYSEQTLVGVDTGVQTSIDFMDNNTDATIYIEFYPPETTTADIMSLCLFDYSASSGGIWGLSLNHYSQGKRIYLNTSNVAPGEYTSGVKNTAAIKRSDIAGTNTVRLNGNQSIFTSTTAPSSNTNFLATGYYIKSNVPTYGATNLAITRVRVFDRDLSTAELETLEAGEEVVSDLRVSWDIGHGNIVNSVDGVVAIRDGQPNDLFIPRDESDPTKDVLNNILDFSGRVPYDAALINSNCGTFDGVDDYVDVPVVSGDHKTVSIWFYTSSEINSSSAAKNMLGASVSSGYIVTGSFASVISNETISLRNSPNTTYIQDTVPAGWNHLVIAWDGSKYQFYLNGTARTTLTQGSGVALMSDESWNIGTNSNASVFHTFRFFNFSVYDYSLTLAQITALYEGTPPATPPTCQLKFNEGAGTTIHDSSGNDNHGTATNVTESAFWATKQNKFHGNLKDGCSQVATFDGIDDYIEIDETKSQLSIASDFSGSLRFKLNSTTTSQSILSSTASALDRFAIHIQSNIIRVSAYDGASVSKSASITDTENWHLFEWSYDSSANTITASLDGTDLVGTDVASLYSDVGCKIGSASGGQIPINGSVRDLIITGGSSYSLGDGKGTLIKDSSVNENHGTATNINEDDFWALKIPAKSALLDATSQSLTNPAVVGHNGAETQIDFDPFDAPALNNVQSGLSFDGTDDYVRIPDAPNLRIVGSWSVSCWLNLKTTPTPLHSAIIAKGASGEVAGTNHNYAIFVEDGVFGSGEAVTALYEDSSGNNVTARYAHTIENDEWNYWAAVHDADADTLSLYKNGTLVASNNSATATPDTGAIDIVLASRQDDNNFTLDCTLSDTRIYDKAISADEVLHLFNGTGTDPTTTNLQGHWKLTDATTSTAPDSSSNGNDGTVNGAAIAYIDPPDDYSFGDVLPPTMTKVVDSSVKESNFTLPL